MHAIRTTLGTVAVAFVLCALGGCGGSGPPTAVQLGDAKIAQTSVEHWTKALAGQAFVVDDGLPAPPAVLANLANSSRCATNVAPLVEKVRSASKASGKPATAAQLQARCHALYASAKQQATEYLISVQVALAEADKYGIKVSPADARRYLTNWKKTALANPSEFGKYLANRGWTLADELFDAKRSVLWLKLTQHLHGLAVASGGGEKAYADLLRTNAQQLAKQTRCSVAYMVPGCSGYRVPAHPLSSLAVAAERLVSG